MCEPVARTVCACPFMSLFPTSKCVSLSPAPCAHACVCAFITVSILWQRLAQCPSHSRHAVAMAILRHVCAHVNGHADLVPCKICTAYVARHTLKNGMIPEETQYMRGTKFNSEPVALCLCCSVSIACLALASVDNAAMYVSHANFILVRTDVIASDGSPMCPGGN